MPTQYVRITHSRKRPLSNGGVDLTDFWVVADSFNWASSGKKSRALTKAAAVQYAIGGVVVANVQHDLQFYTNEGGKIAMVYPRWPKTATVKTASNGYLKTAADGLPANNLDNLPDF